MPNSTPPEPWHSFLRALDRTATGEVHLHCLGGFVVTQMYGLARTTVDLDTLSIAPGDQLNRLREKGIQGAEFHRSYGVYLDVVTIASAPYDYDERLTEMFPGVYSNLRLLALDPHGLALTKLSRNIERDREDVKYLGRVIPLELELLRQRYHDELRPYVIGDPKRHDLTLDLWIEMLEEDRKR